MQGVMEGIRVLEVAQWTFVPAAGGVLADWGADVIKVEHPVTGDAQRGLVSQSLGAGPDTPDFMIQQPNRGKRSVGIDIGHPRGRELLYKLVETSDVFLTNFLPEARRRLRIDVEHLRARNPRLIYVRGSGQGARGPDREKGGYDASSFWARGGVAAALTPADRELPIGQRPAFGDNIGAMTIAGGISAALFRRERTGVASVVDISLLSTAMWVMAPDIVASKLVKPGSGMNFTRETAPNPGTNFYRTRDGRWLMLLFLQPDRYWSDFCKHIDRPDLAGDPRFADGAARFENREACIRELDAVFARHTLDEWRRRFETLEGPWAPVQTPAEIPRDPQVAANGYIRTVTTADGKLLDLVANPVQFDETVPELRAAPEQGQHTEEVLLELGLSWEDIASLKQDRAVT